MSAFGFTGILKIIIDKKDSNDLISIISLQGLFPQSILNPLTIKYTKTVGLAEIFIKFLCFSFSAGVAATVLTGYWNIRRLGVIIYTSPIPKLRK